MKNGKIQRHRRRHFLGAFVFFCILLISHDVHKEKKKHSDASLDGTAPKLSTYTCGIRTLMSRSKLTRNIRTIDPLTPIRGIVLSFTQVPSGKKLVPVTVTPNQMRFDNSMRVSQKAEMARSTLHVPCSDLCRKVA